MSLAAVVSCFMTDQTDRTLEPEHGEGSVQTATKKTVRRTCEGMDQDDGQQDHTATDAEALVFWFYRLRLRLIRLGSDRRGCLL